MQQNNFIETWFGVNNMELEYTENYSLCSNCYTSLANEKMPQMSKWNGFTYPLIPIDLPELDIISERLVAPRLPFMQIRRLRRDFSYGIIGQVINVPVDVQDMILELPRQLDDDYAINVNIKRSLLHKSNYLTGYVNKKCVMSWLKVLINSTLYK